MIYSTNRLNLINDISFINASKNRLWIAVLKIIYTGEDVMTDDGSYSESIDYDDVLLRGIMGIRADSVYYNNYREFKKDFVNCIVAAGKYCGYDIEFIPTGKYKSNISGETIPDKVVIYVQKSSDWEGKIELTNNVITQKLVNDFRAICGIAKEMDKKYNADNIYEMCIIDPKIGMYNWSVRKVQILIDNFVEGNMKTKVIEGQVNIFNNSFKEESEVIDVEEKINIMAEHKLHARYDEWFKQGCIDFFMNNYYQQYVDYLKANPNSTWREQKKFVNKIIKLAYFRELRSKYPNMFIVSKSGPKVSEKTIWDWIKKIPEFDAVRPKNPNIKPYVASVEVDEPVDVMNDNKDIEMAETVVNLQSSNEVRTVYTGTTSEDELYEPSSTSDTNISQQFDESSEETAIADINETAVKVEEENETYIWEVKIDYQMVSSKLFKKYINCTHSGKYIAECANDAYVQALDYLVDSVENDIIYPKSDKAMITKQGVVKSSC